MARIPEERGYRDVRRSDAPMVDYPVPMGPQPPMQVYGGNTYGQLGPLGQDPRHIGSVSAHNDPYHSTMSAVSVNGAVGPVVSYYSRDPHVLWAPSVPDPMLLLDKFMSMGRTAPDPQFVAAMGKTMRDLGKPVKGGGGGGSTNRGGSTNGGGNTGKGGSTNGGTNAGNSNAAATKSGNSAGSAGGGVSAGTPPVEGGKSKPVYTDAANDGGAGEAYTINDDGTVTLSPDVQDRADRIKGPIEVISGPSGRLLFDSLNPVVNAPKVFKQVWDMITGSEDQPATLSEASESSTAPQQTPVAPSVQSLARVSEVPVVSPSTGAASKTPASGAAQKPSVLRESSSPARGSVPHAAPRSDPMDTPSPYATYSSDITEYPQYDRMMDNLRGLKSELLSRNGTLGTAYRSALPGMAALSDTNLFAKARLFDAMYRAAFPGLAALSDAEMFARARTPSAIARKKN